jgi:hypothetical protein
MGRNAEFFERHYERLLVINGLATMTNSHEAGTRFVNSGKLGEGHPSLMAVIAAEHGPTLPLGFVTNGGYDLTRGLVPRTRIGNLDALRRIAYPNRINDDYNYTAPSNHERLLRYVAERRQRKIAAQTLPRLRAAIEKLDAAHGSENELARLVAELPDLSLFTTGLGRQAAVAIAGYRTGITISANLSTGGFDTHSDHVNRQTQALDRLSSGIDEIWDEVVLHGLEDRVVILVTSDFGRTPGFNDGNGKDHWPVTSMMVMGPGIVGNRVVGASDEGHRGLTVDPVTLAPDPEGIVLTPAHVSRALRELAGVSSSVGARAFPIEADLLPILAG